jgi:hypothetical protein
MESPEQESTKAVAQNPRITAARSAASRQNGALGIGRRTMKRRLADRRSEEYPL